jgi:hypothetical protein
MLLLLFWQNIAFNIAKYEGKNKKCLRQICLLIASISHGKSKSSTRKFAGETNNDENQLKILPVVAKELSSLDPSQLREDKR